MALTELRNLKHMLDFSANEYGDRAFMEYKENDSVKSKTYKELKSACDSISIMLNSKRIEEPHVAIVGNASFEWVSTAFGTADCGGVCVPLAPGETDEMNCTLMNFADVNVLAFDKAHKSLYLQSKADCRIELYISLDNTSESDDVINISDILTGYQGDFTNEPDSDALCLICFTSGTTGFPKGVMLSHKNLVMSATSVHVACPTTRIFLCLPIHHMFCFTATITKSICRGKTVCVNDSLANLVPNLRLYKPDSIIAVPQIVKKLMEGAIRFAKSKPELSEKEAVAQFLGGNIIDIISGGAPLDASANARYNATGILVLNGYGMSECSPIISNNAVGSFRHGSVGKPIPCMDVRIVDGEIMCKGPSVMLGYYNNPEATAQAFDEDGYLHTGDLGHFDDDGFLYITGRCKNLILLDNGENVSAEMLEERFYKEPSIAEVVCFGAGGAIYAEIYPNKQWLSENGIDNIESIMADILSRVNSELAFYQHITGYIIRTVPFEKTSSQKIRRVKRDSVEKAPSVKPENLNEQRVYDAVCSVLEIKECSMTDNFFAIGGSSLNTVELSVALNVKPQLIYDNPFLNKLAEKLDNDKTEYADKINGINEIINETRTEEKVEYNKAVLLTGATGFLGIHILSELINKGKELYCLVRNEEKLFNQAEYYFNGLDFSGVHFIRGDIESDKLGLTDGNYEKLCNSIDCVYHIAANVHHSGDYADLERTNVKGTKNIIKFCLDSGAVLQHTSTVSLHGAATCKQSRTDIVFDENILDINQFYADNVYIHSKYVAEQEVITARKAGLKANIYRIGNLTWRESDGRFQINSADNGFIHRLNAMLKLGLYHENMEKYPIDLTPVDECAKAFVNLAGLGFTNEIYHLYNDNYLSVKDMFSWFDVAYKEVSTFETIETMFANTDDADIHVYLFYMIIAARSENIEMNNAFTLARMKNCDTVWSVPDKDYLLKSGIKKSDFSVLKPMRNYGGVLNPVQKIILGAIREAKAFDGGVKAYPGAISSLKEVADELSISKPLIITIPEKFRTEKLTQAINDIQGSVIFDSLCGEPTTDDMRSVLDLYNSQNCDGIIAIGGGSVLDIGKVVSLCASAPGRKAEDICKIFAITKPAVPFVAVPTTAGTGSEATIFAVLTDTKTNKKTAFTSDKFYPDIVILDPELTVSVPSSSTAYTGIDALSHVIESYISLFAPSFPEDIAFGEKAVSLIFRNLKEVVIHPDNVDARFRMQQAAFYAGRCFGRVSTGYIHAIAHRLGELYHIPHGLAVACCIIPVLEAYGDCVKAKIAELSVFAGISKEDDDTEIRYNEFMNSLKQLLSDCDINTNIEAFNESDIDIIVRKAQEEIKAVGCPRPFSDMELSVIVSRIVNQ